MADDFSFFSDTELNIQANNLAGYWENPEVYIYTGKDLWPLDWLAIRVNG